MMRIDKSIIEGAYDSANEIQILSNIIIPLCKPGIVRLVLICPGVPVTAYFRNNGCYGRLYYYRDYGRATACFNW